MYCFSMIWFFLNLFEGVIILFIMAAIRVISTRGEQNSALFVNYKFDFLR